MGWRSAEMGVDYAGPAVVVACAERESLTSAYGGRLEHAVFKHFTLKRKQTANLRPAFRRCIAQTRCEVPPVPPRGLPPLGLSGQLPSLELHNRRGERVSLSNHPPYRAHPPPPHTPHSSCPLPVRNQTRRPRRRCTLLDCLLPVAAGVTHCLKFISTDNSSPSRKLGSRRIPRLLTEQLSGRRTCPASGFSNLFLDMHEDVLSAVVFLSSTDPGDPACAMSAAIRSLMEQAVWAVPQQHAQGSHAVSASSS